VIDPPKRVIRRGGEPHQAVFGQLSLGELARMPPKRFGQHLSNVQAEAPMELKKLAQVVVSTSRHICEGAREFDRECGQKIGSIHAAESPRQLDIRDSKRASRALASLIHEQPDAVPVLGIVLLEASAENREAATQALGTLAAMWPIGLDLVYPRAAYGPRDQIGTVMCLNPFNHLRLGEQRVRVLDCDRVIEEGSQKLIDAGDYARMRRSCRTGSDDVFGDRQVHADDTVLIEADPVGSDDPGDHGAKGDEEERAGSLGILDGHPASLGHPYGYVQNVIASLLLKRTGQSTLAARKLGRGVVADQNNSLLLAKQILDSSGQ
jgi:hypothetical protein